MPLLLEFLPASREEANEAVQHQVQAWRIPPHVLEGDRLELQDELA